MFVHVYTHTHTHLLCRMQHRTKSQFFISNYVCWIIIFGNSLYEDLLNKGLLKPLQGQIEGDKIWPQGTQHFVAPHGMNSLVEYYLEKSGM